MPADDRFSLTDAQTERLLNCRAAWEEGEGEERLERLRQREEDAETLRAFARLLEEAGFAQGGGMHHAQTARLLQLTRALAPNPNLDSRLLRQPDEPAAFNQDLRDLLFGSASLPLRLRGFLQRRHAGGQTVMQFLCAAFPTQYPLVTRTGLQALELSAEQCAAALREARRQYDLPDAADTDKAPALPNSDSVLRLLSDLIIYAAARDVLGSVDYVEVHRLLTRGLAAKPARASRISPSLYAPQVSAPPAPVVREAESPGYETAATSALEPIIAPQPDISGVQENDVLDYLEQYVAAQGFTYPPLTVRDYYISLQTKPFALLSGLSGTGKTRLSALFAEALTGAPDAQYRLLPVRPDWTDSAPLLGYVNLLAGGGEGRFVSTPFLDFLRAATRPENAHRAFFLCLDEMNLARVEYYFAEILSAMETPTRDLLLPDGRSLRLPSNLFLTGTLNLDEATHSLSRKVLDRANVLAFQEVCLREETSEEERKTLSTAEFLSPETRQAVFLTARVTGVAAARTKLRQVGGGVDFAAQVVEQLSEVNALLEPHDLHFGYRVRDEALRYCANSFDRAGRGLLASETPAENLRVALDLQLTQKVLPRFTGARESLETPIRDLLRWTEKARFPSTTRRLNRLLTRLMRDGFVTFDQA